MLVVWFFFFRKVSRRKLLCPRRWNASIFFYSRYKKGLNKDLLGFIFVELLSDGVSKKYFCAHFR